MLTWKEIVTASIAAGFFHGYMAAEENASETVYVEKSRPEADFDTVALASLEDAMANGNLEAKEHEFFVNLGVKY